MNPDLLSLTADIAAAHVEHNEVAADALPGMIQDIYRALAALDAPSAPAVAQRIQEPAVPIRRSVFPDYIVCLEDGKKLIMLKRYVRVRYGMTPDDYRRKWGLPSDYPMTAPDYTKRRVEIAKDVGLGKRASDRLSQPSAQDLATEPAVTAVPARRARGYKG